MTLKPEPGSFKPIRHPCPLGAMGSLYLVRLDNGDYHCRKCEKPVADLSGQSLDQVKHFVATNPGTCIKITPKHILRHE